MSEQTKPDFTPAPNPELPLDLGQFKGHVEAPWEVSCRDGTIKVRGPATAKKYKQREVCRVYGANTATVKLLEASPRLLAEVRRLREALQEIWPFAQVPVDPRTSDFDKYRAANRKVSAALAATKELPNVDAVRDSL